MNSLTAAVALAAVVAAASALYAHESEGSKAHDGEMMGSGMMGMMNMMGQMGGMMDHCNQMMQGMTGDGTGKPNEQWRKEAPAVPDQSD
jgi:hypothetical protein